MTEGRRAERSRQTARENCITTLCPTGRLPSIRPRSPISHPSPLPFPTLQLIHNPLLARSATSAGRSRPKGGLPIMTRRYEAVYIFDSTLEDAAINEKIARFHALLQSPDEISVDHWGRRQLAYKIGPRDTGYYAIARFHADADHPPGIRARDEARRRRRPLPHHAVRARSRRSADDRGGDGAAPRARTTTTTRTNPCDAHKRAARSAKDACTTSITRMTAPSAASSPIMARSCRAG